MTMNDLSPYFHLTIRDAADKLDVSDSVVKKISRLGNLKRWPQRKVCMHATPLVWFCSFIFGGFITIC